MKPRQILIVVAVAIVAFGAAFGIAGAGGKEEGKAQASTAPKAPEVIEVPAAKVTASVADAGALPALNVPKKKKPKAPAATAGGTTTTLPADTGGTTTVTPPSTNTTTQTPQTTTTTPAPQTSNPQPEQPIKVGGGED